MNTVEVFGPGSEVKVGGVRIGRVIQASIRDGGFIHYEIAFISAEKYESFWIPGVFVEATEHSADYRIGFKA